MNPAKIVIISGLFIAIAIFFGGDADLHVLLAPSAPENAFQDKVIWITGHVHMKLH